MATEFAVTFATEKAKSREKPIHYIFGICDAVRARHAKKKLFKIGTE